MMSAPGLPSQQATRDPLISIIVGLGGLLAISFLLALSGRLSNPGLVLPWFVPAVDLFVALVTLSVAMLAAGRWSATGEPAYFWTVVGFAGFAVSILFHLVTFSVATPVGAAPTEPSAQEPARAIFFGHVILTAALLLTAVARWPGARARRRPRALLLAPWLLAPVVLQLLALALASRLHDLINPDGSVTALAPVACLGIAIGAGVGGALSLRRYLGTRDVLSACVVMCQLSLLYFATTLLSCRVTRFSPLWYSYYVAWVAGLVAVLLGLIAESAQLYHREQANTARLRAALCEQERMRRALSNNAERLRLMFEGIGVGVAEVDGNGLVVAANGRFCRMLGYTQQDILGKSIHADLTAPEDRERSRDLNTLVTSGAIPLGDYEKRYLRRDGTRAWVHLTIARLTDGAGEFTSTVGTIEDISARKRAEEEREATLTALRESDRRKDEFLGVLSHELRNPLAPIRSALYILERADPVGEQAARARRIVTRQVEHLTRLVDDLLDVTRIARGKIQLRRTALDLGILVKHAAEDQLVLMQEAGLRLEVVTPDEPLIVHADGARITQVLGNLLQNARKFTGAGGRIGVSLVRHGTFAAIHVRDDGVGIDAELLPRVFEPFTQANQALARTQGGLGLGLALVKGLVELHEGTVRAASTGPGGGSEFTVELPLARRVPEAKESGTPVITRGRGARYRVLVVDDNVDAAEALAECVRMLGHEVEVVHDGPAAIERVATSGPDVVLCDIGMPGMDGYEVAKVLRETVRRSMRLVAVTGYAQPADLRQAAEAGFDAHVRKPPDPARLQELLQ